MRLISSVFHVYKPFIVRMSHSSRLSNDKFHSIFVYGTLKKGEPNHYLIEDSNNGYAKFLFNAQTKSKYALVIGSKYNIPFLIDSEHTTGNNVCGEVYEVDDKMLAVLDELEQHPTVYERKRDEVCEEEDNKCLNVWIYFYQQYTPEMLNLPKLKSYSSTGDPKLGYVPRNMRK